MKAIDPVVGVWEYNSEKSKYINPPTPFTYKSATRTYTQDSEGISSSIKAILADGSPFSEGMTSLKIDGKYHPHWGNSFIDTMAYERVDTHTCVYTAKKGDKVIGGGTRAISPDGKVLRMTFIYTDAEGIVRGHVTHYDRQEG
ncbi:hypothetical protein [Bradyrhizobium niftali]|uniref:Lipocalin-like domain-containing protein n=1 Tax=Bradyrhizobium niftali TaxID=2560055 RepID=A0A4Y9L1M5_9BRAD|nr:hypothetical protein [Bradyrhizobium niftali]TFV36617.1 hypothetical protein E4K65_44805 [Bradyrhizobium niftali]